MTTMGAAEEGGGALTTTLHRRRVLEGLKLQDCLSGEAAPLEAVKAPRSTA